MQHLDEAVGPHTPPGSEPPAKRPKLSRSIYSTLAKYGIKKDSKSYVPLVFDTSTHSLSCHAQRRLEFPNGESFQDGTEFRVSLESFCFSYAEACAVQGFASVTLVNLLHSRVSAIFDRFIPRSTCYLQINHIRKQANCHRRGRCGQMRVDQRRQRQIGMWNLRSNLGSRKQGQDV